MNVGLFVDVSDLYHKLRRKFNKKLSYTALCDAATADVCYAYVAQREGEASAFINFLQLQDFIVRVKRPHIIKVGDRSIRRCSFGVEMTLDVIREAEILDTIILATSNPDYVPLVKYLQSIGKSVTICGCGVSHVLAKTADEVVEIEEDLLEK